MGMCLTLHGFVYKPPSLHKLSKETKFTFILLLFSPLNISMTSLDEEITFCLHGIQIFDIGYYFAYMLYIVSIATLCFCLFLANQGWKKLQVCTTATKNQA